MKRLKEWEKIQKSQCTIGWEGTDESPDRIGHQKHTPKRKCDTHVFLTSHRKERLVHICCCRCVVVFGEKFFWTHSGHIKNQPNEFSPVCFSRTESWVENDVRWRLQHPRKKERLGKNLCQFALPAQRSHTNIWQTESGYLLSLNDRPGAWNPRGELLCSDLCRICLALARDC